MKKIIFKKEELDGFEYLPAKEVEYCLDKEFVNKVINIIISNNKLDPEILNKIREIEEIHRKKVIGLISKVEEEKLLYTVNMNFVKKYKIWLYQTEESVLFYEYLNS